MSDVFTDAELERPYDIIRFEPTEEWYYGDGEVPVPLGASRVGGPVMDLPAKDLVIPPSFVLAAQLDLAAFAPFDEAHLLPATGQLYVFASPNQDEGVVLHADVPNDRLVRVVRAPDQFVQNLGRGCLLRDLRRETETLAEHFVDDPDNGDTYDPFGGSEKSKLFGLYTLCQMGEAEMKDFMLADRMQLVQLGEDFTGFGTLNVCIRPRDLAQRKFDACQVLWSVS